MECFINIHIPWIASLLVTIVVGLLIASRLIGRIEMKFDTKVDVKECNDIRTGCQGDIKVDFEKLWKNYDSFTCEFKETKGMLVEAVENTKESTREIKKAVAELQRANGRH